MRKPVAFLALVSILCLLGGGVAEAKKKKSPPPFTRTDPVVMTGVQLPRLLGSAPESLVAYRYKPGKGRHSKPGRWVAVPVQVDERAVVDFGQTPTAAPGSQGTVYGTAPVGATELQYADPNTFVGPDPDPKLDANDEVAFMASDTGRRAPPKAKRPGRVLRGGATRVVVQDPLTSAKSWIYLFRANGPAKQPADYVTYDFHLLSGNYKQTYHRNAGPNPEASTISTANYSAGFSDRWFFDALAIAGGGASRADILDGYKFAFAPGSCGRSEATFNAGEGAFVVNKDGPVRAIRSYIGANSGPYTERTDLFYGDRHEILTDLRVHPVPGLFSQYDMSPAATGMTYYDQQHQGGVPVDGVPDTLPGTIPSLWHLWKGPQGTLFVNDQLKSSFAAAFLANATAFYMDDSTPPISQCWGDSQQIGAAGLSSTAGSGIPATIPGAPDYLRSISTNLMLPPTQAASAGPSLSQKVIESLSALSGKYKAR
jgi:hypothetical protein